MNEDFINIIKDLLKIKFPKLNSYNIEILTKYTNIILNIIYIKLFNKNINVLKNEMTINNHNNLKRLFYYLLPYIKINDEPININSLDELITKKKNNETYNENNKDKNLYQYTNIQLEYGYTESDISNSNNSNFKENDYKEIYLKSILTYLILSINLSYYKLYVNWINIYPISYTNYKNSNLYKNTFKYDFNIRNFIVKKTNTELDWFKFMYQQYNIIDIEKILDSSVNNKMLNYRGIPLDEVYNVFINYYYKSAETVVFLFNDIIYNKERLPLIKVLDNLFNNELINNILNLNWNSLNTTLQQNLLNKWLYIINNNINIVKIVITAFNNYYEKIGDIKNYKIINELSLHNILENFNNENFEYIYEFLLLSINKLKHTPYYFYLFDNKDIFVIQNKYLLDNELYKGVNNFFSINNNKKYYFNNKITKKNNNIIFDNDIIDINDIYLTCYDIYLFSKKLYNKIKCDNFYSCSESQHESIKSFFQNEINGNIDNDNNKSNGIINTLNFGYMCVNSFEITFHTLCKFGVLSEFKSNNLLTDYKNHILGNDLKEQEKNLKNNLKLIINKYNFSSEIIEDNNNNNFKELYNNNNYYVNNSQYKDLLWLKYNKDYSNTKVINKDYFDILHEEEDIKWFTTFTFHWTSQIDFYNKFINKRVILVTGGTGQGKSTFFPMLIYYGLKAFDYNLFGKLVITQPRITPVVENTLFIAKQLYVPLEDYNPLYSNKENDKNTDTLNGYIQYAHSGKEHINLKNNYYMRLVTDGKLLYQSLIKNILLKKKIITNKKINKFKFIDENEIDIIGIDESHEHNANMDIILSIIKYSMLYNTSLRLFIISATLDDDEPIYRRFYKVLNDNLKYPLVNPYYININYLRNYLDRRFHISPPGKETRFEIIENYEEVEPKNLDEGRIIGISKVLNILANSENGEILFFTYTSKECRDICNELNKKTNFNTVALPFYKDVLVKYKRYLEDLGSYKKLIDIDKKLIVDVFTGNIELPLNYTKTSYDRIIIVATNIAEASITINNLKFVVDLGLQNTVYYNPYKEINIVEIKPISESSRIQRKGRVGRKESGTVYYIYEKDSRLNNKIEYDICNKNLSDTINSLLTNNYLELKVFHNLDIYKNINFFLESDDDSINKFIINFKYLPEYYLFEKQYLLKDNFNNIFLYFKDLLNNNTEILFKELNSNYYLTHSGFNYINIYDNYGYFYIIHPQENLITRDIRTGQIIKYYDIINNDIHYKNINPKYNKISYYIQYLQNLNIIVNLNTNITDFDNYKLAKTNINKLFIDISKYFTNPELDILSLLIHCNEKLYNCVDDILILISIIKECPELSKLYEYKNKKYNLNFKKFYKRRDGDIFIIILLIKNILKKYNIDINLEPEQNTYLHYYKLYISKNKKLDIDIYNDFQKQRRHLILNDDETKKDIYNTKKLNNIFKSLDFLNWCKYYCINSNSIELIINKYIELNKEFYKFVILENEKYYNIFDKLDDIYVNKYNNLIDNITKCLLTTYKHQLVEYKGSHYYSILKDNILFNNQIIPNVDESIIIHNQYLIYLNLKLVIEKNSNIERTKISYLININNVEDIFEVSFNIYNLKNYVSYNSNFINNYNVSFLNKTLHHIIMHTKKKINNDIVNILDYIKNKDKEENLYDKDIKEISNEYYNERNKILNSIDFYYYFIKILLKN